MQHDQPGERPQGKEQVTPPPRVRAGTRAAMRVTNRYTMPPLAPRGQQYADRFWNAQDQDEEVAASAYQPVQPLSPAEEDAWLNDVLPPSRPIRSHGSTSGEVSADGSASTGEWVRTDGEVRASGGTRAGEGARASGGTRMGEGARATEKARATARVAPTIHAPGAAPAEYGRGTMRDPCGRPDSSDHPGFSPV